MQFVVLCVILGASISTLCDRQFYAVDEFDVRTVVKFAGVTGRWVTNEKSNRSPTGDLSLPNIPSAFAVNNLRRLRF